MSAIPKRQLTVQEYLVRERVATFKSEFYNGEAFVMAGASYSHNRMTENFSIEFGSRLKSTRCQGFSQDLRVLIEATGLFCYPDFLILCGPPTFSELDPDTLTNPRVIVEVLTPSSERYDRITKFRHYRQIPSLVEFLLVSSTEPLIEHFTKRDDGAWSIEFSYGLDQTLKLLSIPVEVSLKDLFADVNFPEEASM